MPFVTVKFIVIVDFLCCSGIVYDEPFFITIFTLLKEMFSYGYSLSVPKFHFVYHGITGIIEASFSLFSL